MSRKPDSESRLKQDYSKFQPPFGDLLRFDQEPLIFDPENPEAFLEEVAWRCQWKVPDTAGPVPITRLLNSHEIHDVKQIETAVDGMQEAIREIWEKEEREKIEKSRKGNRKGGLHSAKRKGIVKAVEELIWQSGRILKSQELWEKLDQLGSQRFDVDNHQYLVYRDGEELLQERVPGGKILSVKEPTFYKNYYLPKKRILLKELAPKPES